MARRPSFQFYPADWRGNTKLRGASLQERAAWLECMCLFSDSDEYGVLRWDLGRIASVIPCHVDILQSLVQQDILKGAAKGEQFEGFRHTDRNGVSHLLIEPTKGPIWFSSRMVLDEHLRRIASVKGRTGGNPALKGGVKAHPKPPSSSSASPSCATPEGVGGEADEFGDKLDREVRAYFAANLAVLWSPAAHARVRKLVEAGGWDKARECIDVAVSEHASDPTSYAQAVYANQQAKARVAPPKRPVAYKPVTGWKGG